MSAMTHNTAPSGAMHVLVYGARGWIGGQFVQVLRDRDIAFTCGSARADNISDVDAELATIHPTHVVSFIGRTHGTIGGKTFSTIDYLEQDGKLTDNVRDNLFSPVALALSCRKRGVHYTYLGTGCIFKFDEDHPFGEEERGFAEDDLPNFFGSSYSVVKGFTDQLMQMLEDNVLNLRIRMPIVGTPNPRNFITKIATYEKVCSVPNSMSVLDELLPYVVQLMQKGTTGTLNFTNPGLISHNEILEMYKEIVDPSFAWTNFSLEEQRAILAADRSNNYMDTRKLEELFPEIEPIKTAVRRALVKYSEANPQVHAASGASC